MAENGRAARAETKRLLRQIPSVDRLLQLPAAHSIVDRFGRSLAVEALREVLEAERHAILAGSAMGAAPDTELVGKAEARLAGLIAPTLRPVINGSGVIIHTNLGRSPLSDSALAAVREAAATYSSLEYDLDEGQRGSRTTHAAALLTSLTGAGAALVVNNNAAAVLLMLTALCRDREVIISRSQLVEIGGGFRVPDVMAQSGARLVEVGTTNRTHLRDYEAAIGDDTAAILVAHHSNYKIIGFTAEPPLADLAELAHAHHLPLLFDQGSGALLETSRYGLEAEPTVQEGLAAGCDLVAFSGDKLLGGPQAGILVGRQPLIARLRAHPLARALRPDKMCLAALASTLLPYLTGRAETEIPVWRMIARLPDDIKRLAEQWASHLGQRGLPVSVLSGESTVGGGSLPGATLPTWLLAIEVADPDRLAARLRENDPPIVGRIAGDRYLIDPRTVLDGQETKLLSALEQLC